MGSALSQPQDAPTEPFSFLRLGLSAANHPETVGRFWLRRGKPSDELTNVSQDKEVASKPSEYEAEISPYLDYTNKDRLLRLDDLARPPVSLDSIDVAQYADLITRRGALLGSVRMAFAQQQQRECGPANFESKTESSLPKVNAALLLPPSVAHSFFSGCGSWHSLWRTPYDFIASFSKPS